MDKKIFIILVLIHFIKAVNVTLGEERPLPNFGFNGNTVRGPSWINSEFVDSVATMKPDILRYPGGLGTYWDWNTGWFLEEPMVDTLLIDSLPNNWSTLPYIDIRPIHFQNASTTIESVGIYSINMITASLDTMIQWINNALEDGISITNIELGSEINHNNEYKILKYPTAGDYARDCNIYIDTLSAIIPDATFTLVGGNRSDTERSMHWNDSLYTIVDPGSYDALAWHVYLYMKDEHLVYSDRKFISYPYYDIPRIEEWRGFQDTTAQLQNYKINVTEYNLFDRSDEGIYRNTWLHALFLSSMTDNILNNNLVNMLLAHNVSGPTGFDAINNDEGNHFPKTATAFSMMLYNFVSKDMTNIYKLNFPSNFTDTIEYANSNNVTKDVECPRIFGWKFSNAEHESGILTNITDTTYSISLDNAYSDNLLWIHWSVDSLRAPLNGYNSIIRSYSIGLENIIIPMFSINTCKSILEGDANEDYLLNVIDIIIIVNSIIGETIVSDKQFVIIDMNEDNLLNVVDVIEIVNIILSY